jgi:anti-sigma factor RsiW
MSEVRGAIAEEQIHAYFDGELHGSDRARVEDALAADPALRRRLDDLALLHDAVVASLDAAARAVPESRFEAMWPAIEEAAGRGARRARGRRLAFRVLLPGLVAAAAVVVAALVLRPSRKAREDAPLARAPVPREDPRGPVAGTLARPVEMVEPFAAPSSNQAVVDRIQFGGRGGQISTVEGSGGGTTTVVWAFADEPPAVEEAL